MIIKLITILIFVFLIYKMTKSIQSAFKGAGERMHGETHSGEQTKPPVSEDAEAEETVFDEMCSSYIPKTGAIMVESKGDVHYFCSGACRQTFLNSHGGRPY
ncbi:MAG: hypothetical protein KAR06_09055 [Deltaproteobacteria bacterium]|nr:hypothetical protein [Deltaproteobacteria bacterium]